jgi:CRISPR-associated endonuclease/helicase Cas3
VAQENAAKFGAGDVARLVGLWHDIGKFNPAF